MLSFIKKIIDKKTTIHNYSHNVKIKPLIENYYVLMQII